MDILEFSNAFDRFNFVSSIWGGDAIVGVHQHTMQLVAHRFLPNICCWGKRVLQSACAVSEINAKLNSPEDRIQLSTNVFRCMTLDSK